MANEESKTSVTSPPAGTGNVPGLGEAFNINLSTGQGVYSYKIALPSGVAGHTPTLTLEYAHGAGHGVFGLGWKVPLRSISRRLDFGVPGEGTVESYMDSGSDILPMPDGAFTAQVETVFSRYSRISDGWRVEERNGIIHELGSSPIARLTEPGHPERVNEWLLERSLDPSGNAIEYGYLIDEGIAYLAEVRYAIYAVRFSYEDRPDPRLNSRTGYLRKCGKRCNRIGLYIDPESNERRMRSWTFTYTQAVGSNVSLLSSIQMISHGVAADGSQDVLRAPATFHYTPFELQRSTAHWMESPDGSSPPPLTDPDVALVTLDSAPLPGVLRISNGRQYYWRNLGDGTWAAPHPVSRVPAVSSFARSGLAFIDMNASGTADLLVAAGESLPGYYENGGGAGWSRFVAYPRGRRSAPFWISGQVRLSDVNGDGRIDAIMSAQHSFAVWLNEGQDGWSDPLLVPRGEGDGLPNFSDPLVFLADMSGDGLDDLVRVRSGLVEYWPGLGWGRFGKKQVMENSPRLRGLTPVAGRAGALPLMLADVDGDGCTDLVSVTASGVEVCLNQNGISFSKPIFIPDIPPPIPGTVRAINMRGRSGTGLIWNAPRGRQTGYVSLEFGSKQPAYLLNRIENGMGLVSEIFYRSAVEDFCRDRQAGTQWDTNFPFPYLVVAGTRETDLISRRVSEINYHYHEAHFEPGARQFQGFRRTERQEIGDESRANTLTIFHFLMGQERLPGNGPEHAVLNGMLSRIETYQLDGSAGEDRAYRTETSDYGLAVLNTTPDGRQRSFVFVMAHRQEDTERTDDSRIEEKIYTYDTNGNVLRERHRGTGTRDGIAQPVRERSTEITYSASATHYLLDKPARIVVRDQNGQLLSEKRFFYDGPDFVGLSLGQADHGLLIREEEWVLSEADFNNHYAGMNRSELGFHFDTNVDGVASVFASRQRNRYDARGVLLAARDAFDVESRFTYDPSGLFRLKLTDPLGETRFEYDRATRQITQVTYADGAVTRFAYDAQGRLLKSALPGEDIANPAIIYAYDEATIPNKRTARFRQSGGVTSLGISYFDGFGKEFQQRVEVEHGRFLVSGLKLPNPWGDLREEFEPVFSPCQDFAIPDTANCSSRCFFYDGRGRIVRSVNFNGGVSTAEYQPFRVILRDANDNDDSTTNQARGQFNTPREEEFDVFRYLIRVTDHLEANKQIVTNYEVGPLGELLAVADGRGVRFRYRYDRCGNRIAIVLRESGERKIWYDVRKKPVRTLDPAGHDLRAAWDALGRQTSLSSGTTIIEEYHYDTAAQHAFGRVAEVRYIGGRQAFIYSEAGHLLQRDYFFDGEAKAHTLRYEYDSLGRETAVIHTDGTRIDRHLTLNGWLKSIPNFIQNVEYNPRGFPTEILYQNGVHTHYAYTLGPGRISHQTSISPQNDILEQTEFTFDKMDVLLSRDDAAPGGVGVREFSYDPLYQITSVSSVENGISVRHNYDYAADYNLRRFDESHMMLHYDDPNHPDRLSGLITDGDILFAVNYDGNGNLLNLPGQQFGYNSKNELTRLTNTDGLVAEYCYDHMGFRISKELRDGQGHFTRILCVGDQAEIRNGMPVYFVTVGPLRIAVLAAGTVCFLHDNGLGSTGFVTDSTGQRIGIVDYQPFGNVADSNGSVDFRTFSLHPVDSESGLVYMRRRYYSPRLGRFLTPDLMAIYQPEKFLHFPQSLHLYAFVGNNPLNRTDPTGMSFWSFLGSVVGIIVGVVAAVAIIAAVVATGGTAGILLGIGLALGASLAVTGVSYLIASAVDPNSAFGQFVRGFMIGFNAGMNGVLAGAIFGPVVGVSIGVINFLATFDGIAQNSVYQGILGWTSWLMPMSWIATGLGLVFYAINLVVAGITFQQWEAAKIEKLAIDWKTGSIVMVGGLIRGPTAFDMGNFVFMNSNHVGAYKVDSTSRERIYELNEGKYKEILSHETGHTLSVAAFGTSFGICDLIGENIVGLGAKDYGERIAESHANRSGRPTIPMWG
ncbi:hypothetical protein HZA56_01455 [Candidatus Poribacteria bacterium]|nr:hypothetical protein [Candidatus Poribacteria bacterium]